MRVTFARLFQPSLISSFRRKNVTAVKTGAGIQSHQTQGYRRLAFYAGLRQLILFISEKPQTRKSTGLRYQ